MPNWEATSRMRTHKILPIVTQPKLHNLIPTLTLISLTSLNRRTSIISQIHCTLRRSNLKTPQTSISKTVCSKHSTWCQCPLKINNLPFSKFQVLNLWTASCHLVERSNLNTLDPRSFLTIQLHRLRDPQWIRVKMLFKSMSKWLRDSRRKTMTSSLNLSSKIRRFSSKRSKSKNSRLNNQSTRE